MSAPGAIVIGSGHNGLITAAYLARAGVRPLVLERRDRIGGAAVTEELRPGYRIDTAAHRMGPLHPSVIADLELDVRRLPILRPDPTVFAPLPGGGRVVLRRDAERTAEELARLSTADARRWPAFCEQVAEAGRLLAAVYEGPPPRVAGAGPSDLWSLLRVGGRLRRFGRRRLLELSRLLPMSIEELLAEWFESDALKGTLAAAAIAGLHQGPMAAGTAFTFLHAHVGAERGAVRPTLRVEGGLGNLCGALADAVGRLGGEIRTGAEVTSIVSSDGKVDGVVVSGGEALEAEVVVSSLDARRTFLELQDPSVLDARFVEQVQRIKYRGVCAKVNLALGELPAFDAAAGAERELLRGVISISPNVEYLERAYDDAKYGRPSAEPCLEVVIPSVTDPGLAPAGRHVMSVVLQYAPYHLADDQAWDDERREALGDSVVETLSRYAPGLESAILHRQVLSPLDLERRFGLTEGNIYGGEMTLDQVFFMRPVPGCADYRTPVAGLYMCGASTHPGGGLTGYPAYNAAREILADVA